MTAMLEVERVAAHIQRAEALAANRDTSKLSHVQQLVRQLLLQALADYRAGGVFPKNRDFVDKRPYFIDADGTRCAMAHLLELGGEQALVSKIATERNNAYVRELADEPQLLAWLEAAGLTASEAAAIQPEYCSVVSDCICGGDFSYPNYPVPARGVLEGIVQANGKLRIDRTYGDSFGLALGSEVSLANPMTAGAHVVAPIESATAPMHGIVLDAGGTYECSSQGVSQAPTLTANDFASAVLAADCPAELRSQDPAWSSSSCSPEPNNPGDPFGGNHEGGGCSTGAGAEAASIGILLALVTALARRR